MRLGTKRFYLIVLSLLYLAVGGCATYSSDSLKNLSCSQKGIYHKVRGKETLWRIAKAYDLTVEDLVSANNIPNAAQIQENQLIFIPGASEQKKVISMQEAFVDNEFRWPIKGRVISYFGNQKMNAANNGIDIESEFGKDVCASRGGRIVFADYLPGYGQTVMIDHGDAYLTVYSQDSDILVSVGDLVVSGDPIAKVGKKDMVAFLHFEIRKKSVASNPLYFLP
ncbi:MAG: peptidoglycan DD-metalloendopeptidase family protein [Candidatus Omnitrophica bacterium]|nr:peptidoglycan DD-metalloendopeptidase family protein [Candidatus Omnitrophota bacterium]